MIERSVPGRRHCLTCGKPFNSPDYIRIRRCKRCKERDRGLSGIQLVNDRRHDAATRSHEAGT